MMNKTKIYHKILANNHIFKDDYRSLNITGFVYDLRYREHYRVSTKKKT